MTGRDIEAMTDSKRLALGSWSEGSTRTEDWADAALSMAAYVGIADHDACDVIRGELDTLAENDDNEWADAALANLSDAVDTLIDALQEYAPIYCYVGAHPGDGADFGVWLSQDALREAMRASVSVEGYGHNGVREYINVVDRVIIDVNDHGNVSVYAIERGAALLEIV